MFKCSSTDTSDFTPISTSATTTGASRRRNSSVGTTANNTNNNNQQQQPAQTPPRRGASIFKQGDSEHCNNNNNNRFRSPSTFSPNLSTSPTTGSTSPTSGHNESFLYHTNSSASNYDPTTRFSNASALSDDMKPEIGILMLGSGGSGKTSLFKQRKLIYEGGFSEKEKKQAKVVIWSEILQILYNFAYELHNGRYDLEFALRQTVFDFLQITNDRCQGNEFALISISEEVFRQAEKWKQFFNEQMHRQILETNNGFSSLFLCCLTPYFREYDRVTNIDYTPTDYDVVLFQKKTTGIVESSFVYMNSYVVKVVDTGGQRNERKKWGKAFQKQPLDCIWFLISLSDFFKVCYENEELNRLNDSLAIFSEWLRSDAVKNVKHFWVVFTHLDELEQELPRLKMSFLKTIVPGVEDGMTANQLYQHISQKFLSIDSEKRVNHIECLNSTDTDQVRQLFDKAINEIIENK
ncbi:hypothetical protein C9374_004820 [Naegleria lovaniensis]|uniref:Uncharacterized protein n=1 Tax=Naegleria lovaniensis TaxID=51637 RepID=A0AA88GQV3_NAELO|nr:uncharacterized protein C9374_004820 [Naegleria lovaniensis]KAG2382853.1 hypothetical protein C9374_004820 [Naegleria lovaniensis]